MAAANSKNDRPVGVTSRSFSQNPVLRTELEEHFSNIRYNDEGLKLGGAELVEFLKDCEGAIVALEKITREVLQQLPQFRYLAKYGVGLDNLDQEAMRDLKVELGWSGGANKQSVAELALCFMLGISREIFTRMRDVREGQWIMAGGNQLFGKTVGVIGCGHVGRQVIELLKPFQCRILGNDILEMDEYFQNNQVIPATKEMIYREADVITLHLPYYAEVHHFLGAEQFAMMQPSAIVINTARGGLMDEEALYQSLKENRIRAAATDVFEQEPPTDHPLLELPNFFPTSHIGGSAREAILNMGRTAIANLKRLMS